MTKLPIRVHAMLFAFGFVGSIVGLSLLGQQFPFMAKGTIVATVLLYVWAALMFWWIYAVFVKRLFKYIKIKR